MRGNSQRQIGSLLVTARSLEEQARRLLARGALADRACGAADRLAASVIRPLDEVRGGGGPQEQPEPDAMSRTSSEIAASSSAGDESSADDGEVARWEDSLWALTRAVTTLRATSTGPPQLLEATAALQDLARSMATDDATRARRIAEIAELQKAAPATIEPEKDGPYLVTNPRRLEDWLGAPLETTPQMALCRCGQSKIKPLCDGTHAAVGFSDAKDPARVADRPDTYVGQQVTVLDNRGACQHSGLCTDRLASVFHLGEEPFVTPSGGRMDEIIRAVRDCPSGALSYAIDGVEARDTVDYHNLRDASIQVTKDGPYRVTGAIPLVEEGGHDVHRNEGASREHFALCRCGKSQNKPFCSGMHWYVGFHDPVPQPDRTPTMFEWCGGLPALTRMTRLFYEKFVPQDPMLAPLFADMSADHPQRVAKWLGEVFGGPPCYSEEYGGYPRMISQHLGKCLTEEWRARWVALLLQSAAEAGLPNDAEFRSAFQGYIEWGSRLAVENSQTGATPPPTMPMPHWDWTTAAGAPGGRVSAVAPVSEPKVPVLLPAADEPVRFEKHIRQLFRERDRTSMSFAFDLGTYADVQEHAEAILERVRKGSMPCDAAWGPDWVDTFARWVQAGKPA